MLLTGTKIKTGIEDLFVSRPIRRFLIISIQVLVIISSLLLAFVLRFDGPVPDRYWAVILHLLPALLVIKVTIFWGMGLFTGWWRYVSIPDLMNLLKANLLATTGFVVYIAMIHRFEDIPRSVPVVDGVMCFLLISGVRILTRIFRENHHLSISGKPPTSVLLVGAGGVGQMIVKEIRQDLRLNKKIIGYLDNDPDRQGQKFQGVPVLGMVKDLETVCRKKGIEQVIISQPAVCSKELRAIVQICLKKGIRSKILPAMGSIINGDVSIQHIRDVQLEDLLGRKPVQLDIQQIKEYLLGKRILVTGAGGSIGSEICRQVAGYLPKSIILLDLAETPLFQIDREIRERCPTLQCHTVLGDVRDRGRIQHVFATFQPDVVFHAAAYKHVPMSEHNPEEAIRNNVLGSRIVADTAHSFGVRHFVMISTDKAVNPTNIMGASKRAAEIYVQSLAMKSRTKFVTVRFGNVLGSNGSVIPTFREQIAKGGPVTVTHPEITRFFMTIPEAAQLVLQAGSMGEGGEIFLLDMGEPVNILQMAEGMIRLSGLRPYEDIDIEISGLRPGEKLHEELLLVGEGVMPTTHKKIRVLKAVACGTEYLDQLFNHLCETAERMETGQSIVLLREIVPEYCPAFEILQLLQKAKKREYSTDSSVVRPSTGLQSSISGKSSSFKGGFNPPLRIRPAQH